MNIEKIKEFASRYEICDGHSHIFPEKIAEKATVSIGDFYDIQMTGSGSVPALLQSGKNIGVKKYLVCSTATTAHQVESINSFIATTCKENPEFIGFGSMHPEHEDSFGQAKFCKENGLRGLKLHPDFQKFNIDDNSAYPIYEAAQAEGLPILFHMGDNRYDYSSPARLKNILRDFPNLIAFAAHLGGYQAWDKAAEVLTGEKNVYFDTCSSLMFISPETAKKQILNFGIEKIFFGTDFPMWGHLDELERFMNLGFSDEENKLLLSENFKRFFSL